MKHTSYPFLQGYPSVLIFRYHFPAGIEKETKFTQLASVRMTSYSMVDIASTYLLNRGIIISNYANLIH